MALHGRQNTAVLSVVVESSRGTEQSAQAVATQVPDTHAHCDDTCKKIPVNVQAPGYLSLICSDCKMELIAMLVVGFLGCFDCTLEGIAVSVTNSRC